MQYLYITVLLSLTVDLATSLPHPHTPLWGQSLDSVAHRLISETSNDVWGDWGVPLICISAFQ